MFQGLCVLVVFLPLCSALVVGVFGRFLGRNGVILIAIPALMLAMLVAVYGFIDLGLGHKVYVIKMCGWIESGMFNVVWGMLFDSLTVSMLVVVTSISMLVHIYSIDYMGDDPHMIRFMSYLSIFTFCMLLLITADNLLQLFLGWEGVGLSSYLLINFWFTRIQANKAAIKAMLMNRVGDFFLGLGIVIIFYVFKTLDFGAIFALVLLEVDLFYGILFFEVDKISLISVLLYLGAAGKSAQLGLHTWLPDAMEGPTPVSALIHAATMVTAGVFLLVRSSPIIEYTSSVLNLIMVFAGVTALFASTVGVFQNDIKRVIAFSTTSQLGYMVLACSLSAYSVGMFHLMNHACFKALLFLSSGAIIHAMGDEQDMRKMGGLLKLMPYVYVCILIGSLALAGVPFLSGFYSKDLILEIAFSNFEVIFGYWFGLIAAYFTAFHSVRLLYYTFYTMPNGGRQIINEVAEVSNIMLFVLTILLIGTMFVGYIMKDTFVGMGSDYWGNAIFVSSGHIFLLESEFLPLAVKIIPTVFSILGGLLAYVVYMFYMRAAMMYLNTNSIIKKLYIFFNKKWFFDIFYIEWVAKFLLKFGYVVTFRVIDRGFIEWVGPYGLVKLFGWLSSLMSKMHTGYLYHYFIVAVFGACILFVLLNRIQFIWLDITILLFGVVMFLFAINKNNKGLKLKKYEKRQKK